MRVSNALGVQRRLPRSPIAAAILLACPAVLAQEQHAALEEIIVTAQKRAENLQDVPISIQAIGNQTLEELHVNNFRDYVQMLPSVTMQPGLGSGSSFTLVYMRGVTTGGDGQAITSQPSVGMYLDEQPITTIQGNLDIHMYDIERVEALAGPQGTLYGASSQAGTIRIITNKPDPSKFAAGYGLEGNVVDFDAPGYVAEGFVNLPLSDRSAVRLVGWSRHDAGWIDNLKRTRTFPANAETTADDITVSNAKYAKNNYNTIDTIGSRAALRINLNDDWSITPGVMYQKQEGKGAWGDDLAKRSTDTGLNEFVPGDQAVAHFKKEFTNDEWYQLGLTIEGRVANFDMTYSGNFLDRNVDGSFDYSDYSFFYDSLYTSGYFSGLHFDNNGDPIPPVAKFTNDDGYTKQSHELRITSPKDNRLRGLLGFFWQQQKHDFQQNFMVDGLADIMLMDFGANPKFKDTVYLNSMDRVDTDEAVFGSLSFDLTDKVELTAGVRFFKAKTSVKGFFGFGLGFGPDHAPGSEEGDLPGEPGSPANGGEGAYAPWGQGWSRNGEWRCPSQADYRDAPCKNVDRSTDQSDHVGRVNINYKVNSDVLLYATWSEGFRPGGINRNPFVGDYVSDFLTNWETGWKTQWLGNSLQFNGAIFFEQWDNLQRAFQGSNGITQVDNAPSAEIYGTELQLAWAATDNLRLSAAASYYDTKLTKDYYEIVDGVPTVTAPKGTELPLTPKFKGNVVARYTFPVAGFDAHLQGALAYETSRPSELVPADNAIKGDIPSSLVLDLSGGIQRNTWSLELYVKNATNERAPLNISAECSTSVCGFQSYGIRRPPTTVGLKFSQDF